MIVLEDDKGSQKRRKPAGKSSLDLIELTWESFQEGARTRGRLSNRPTLLRKPHSGHYLSYCCDSNRPTPREETYYLPVSPVNNRRESKLDLQR
jgi:hypothetical protein